MGRLRDIWRHWRHRKGSHRSRHGKSTPRQPDAALPAVFSAARHGVEESVTISTREELRALRGEFELLRLFAYGDSADALRVLENASRTGKGARFIELRDCLREARHAGISRLCHEIDERHPSIADEIAWDVLSNEARLFRTNVLTALREAPIEGHLEVAASYALSADLRPATAPGGSAGSPSETAMTQPNDPKKSKSTPDAPGAASLEDALQAMEGELKSLTEIVGADNVSESDLAQMLGGASPEEPPVAEVAEAAAPDEATVDDIEAIVDEVMLGEDAAPPAEDVVGDMPTGAEESLAAAEKAATPDTDAPLTADDLEAAFAQAAAEESAEAAVEAPADEVSAEEALAEPLDEAALLAAFESAGVPTSADALLATDKPLSDLVDAAEPAEDLTAEIPEEPFEAPAPTPAPIEVGIAEALVAEFPQPTPAVSLPVEPETPVTATPVGWPAPVAPEPVLRPAPPPPSVDEPEEELAVPQERPIAPAPRHAERPARASRPRRRTGRSSRGTSTRRSREDVENAITDLAEFLETEVANLWDEARASLEDALADTDTIAEYHARAEGLHAEMERMGEELASARRESRLLQAQLLNLRDEVAKAKQRAEMAAFEAQSAADRAKAAAREAETAARFDRGL